jgi:hypothetical protein
VPRSPFIYARALSEAPQAFARRELAAQMAERLGKPGLTIIAGASSAGKSTLLAQIARAAHPVVELATIAAGQAFGPEALMRALSQQMGAPERAAASGDPLAGLVDAPPAPGMLAQLAGPSGVKALALDDSGSLLAWDKAELADLGASLAAHAAGVIMAAKPAQAAQLSDALGEACDVVDLGGAQLTMSEDDVAAALVAIAAHSARGMDMLAAQAIARLTRCHLRGCQLVADRAWRLADGQVDLDGVRSAWQQILSDDHGAFCAPYELLAGGSASEQRLARVLCLVADNAGGRLRSDDLALRYGMGASGRMAIQRDIARLAQLALVEPVGSSWQLADPLLQAWLHARSPWR